MANIPSKPSYSHGSTGTKPGSALDYQNGDPLDANNLDYYLHTEFDKIKGIIDALNTIDSDDDGKVDAADVADNATAYKNNDIDSDGDGVVDAADQLRTGGSAATIRDTTNANNLLVANEGGPVAVPNTSVEMGEISAPSSASTNTNRLYFKSDGNLYKKDENGNESQVGGTGSLSGLTIDTDKDWQNYDITNLRKLVAEDGLFSGKTLESNESLTVATDESFVVSDDYTVESGATLTVNGSMTVM